MNFIRQRLATLQNRAIDLQDGLKRWALYCDDVPANFEKKLRDRLVPAERATFDTDQELIKERLRPVAVQLKTLCRWYEYVHEKIAEQIETAKSLLAQGRAQECLNVLNDVERRMIAPNEETLGFVFRMFGQYASHEHHQKLAAIDAIIRELYLPIVKQAHQRSLVSKETMALTPVAYLTETIDGAYTWRTHARISMNVGRALPISLIGVPRTLLAQPWNLAAIAHEVGLAVYADINLNWEMASKLGAEAVASGVSPQTAPLWAKWHEIIFADVFGTLKLGPAYVSAMVELLGTNPATATACDIHTPVPPACVRWHIMLQTLHHMNFEHQARELRDQIQLICGDANQIAARGGAIALTLLNECRAVAGVVAFSPCQRLAGGRLVDVIGPFLAAEQGSAARVKDLLLAGDESIAEDEKFAWIKPIGETAIAAPIVLAGIRLAFDATIDFDTSRRAWVRFWCLAEHVTTTGDQTREREDREFAPGDAVLKSIAQKAIPTFVTSPIDRPVAMV